VAVTVVKALVYSNTIASLETRFSAMILLPATRAL
jgi:hypothetical protein